MFGVKKYLLKSGNPIVLTIWTDNTHNFWSSDFGEFSLFYEKREALVSRVDVHPTPGIEPFMSSVPTFAVRETVSLGAGYPP